MSISTSNRIIVVDAIRGFALFGILMLHSIEHFELFIFPEDNGIFNASDKIIHDTLFFLFGGKAYSMFAIMFGFSFFIQIKNSEDKGKDFRLGFLWRLIILLFFGYLHSLMYSGDVLVVLGLLGLPLILLYKVPVKWLFLLGFLCILQIPTIFQFIHSIQDPNFVFTESWHHWKNISPTFAEGSLLDVVKMNAKQSYLAKWQFYYNSGRYLQMFGLIILGLAIGKTHYFSNLEKYKNVTLKTLIISLSLFLIYFFFPIEMLNISDTQSRLLSKLFSSYGNFFQTIAWIALFIIVYRNFMSQTKQSLLSTYGKMSLTNYVSQAFVGVVFFYGWGFGMYKYFGQTQSFIYGIIFFVLQLYISKYWAKKFYYGPFEWFWRALTYWDFKLKFKR